jgi:hypothetical protein
MYEQWEVVRKVREVSKEVKQTGIVVDNGRGSVVGIATGPSWGRSSSLGTFKNFNFSISSRQALGNGEERLEAVLLAESL